MRKLTYLLGGCILILGLMVAGCNPTNKTRPAPVRPKVTAPTKKVRPAPTKRTPGLGTVTSKHISDRIAKIETAVKNGKWSEANSETNTLGMDMTKFTPSGVKGKSLRETTGFDSIYVKLQADVKVKNKKAALDDLKRLSEKLSTVKTKTTSQSKAS